MKKCPCNNKARIAELNDLARTAMGVAGRLVQTSGINALPWQQQSRIRELVETFSDFHPGNDPHHERDFGQFTHGEVGVMWKIDYYDKALTAHSPDPSDPSVTERVITIMLAEEYS